MTVTWFAVSGIPQGVEAGNWDYDRITKVNLIGSVGRAGRFEVHFVRRSNTNFGYHLVIVLLSVIPKKTTK